MLLAFSAVTTLHGQNLIFTFSDDGMGGTNVVASGGTAVAVGNSSNPLIGVRTTGDGGDTGFGFINDSFDFASYQALGTSYYADNITLTAGGGLSSGLIDSYYFNNSVFTPLYLTQSAAAGATLSAIGAPDPSGNFAIDYSTFAALHGTTIVNSEDGWEFVFLPIGPTLDIVSLSQAYRVQQVIPKLASTTINGSHHRLLMDSTPGEDGWHAWVTGDFANFNDVDATQMMGEVGASRSFGSDDFRLGLSVGQTVADQDTAFGGGSKIDGDFIVLETNYRLPDSKVILSALLYYGQYDVETKRGYLLGGAKSTGKTDADSAALRLRADWKDAYVSKKFSFTPRFAYTLIDSSADAYTETGGATPVSYASQDSLDHEFRLGVDIDYDLSSQTQFRGIVEAVYRDNEDGGLRGSAGALTFNLPADDSSDLWGRLGVEVVHQLNESTTLNASIFGSTEGYDATVSASLGV